MQELMLVFKVLREHRFHFKKKKCTFAKDELQYLGHIISKRGLATDPSKTKAMLKWTRPSSMTELRGFLGLTWYYRKCVKHYCIITKHLTRLLQGKQ
jgi:hypothetical protein